MFRYNQKINKFVAVSLMCVMVFSMFPFNTVLADEVDQTKPTEPVSDSVSIESSEFPVETSVSTEVEEDTSKESSDTSDSASVSDSSIQSSSESSSSSSSESSSQSESSSSSSSTSSSSSSSTASSSSRSHSLSLSLSSSHASSTSSTSTNTSTDTQVSSFSNNSNANASCFVTITGNTININLGDDLPDPEYTVKDADNNDITSSASSSINYTGNIDTNVSGTYYLNYTVSASSTSVSGNSSSSASCSASASITIIVGNPNPPVPPVNHTCFIPDSLGDTSNKVIKNGNDSTSAYYLQNIFDSKGFNLDAQNDQRQYQIWHPQKEKVSFTVEVLAGNPNTADFTSVFGYYTDGDVSDFSPVFRRGNISPFNTVTNLSYGQSLSFDITGASTVGFMIKTNPGSVWATDSSKNENHNDQVIVYEIESNTYIIAFEDLALGYSDEDYNDVVVKLTVTGCENPSDPDPIPSVSLDANPSTINKGEESMLSWDSNNTSECSAPWTTATSTSGSQVVSPASTTEYAITCTGSGGSATATTTVIVRSDPGPGNQCVVNIVSDATNLVDSTNAVATYNGNPRWTASIPGATWIWSTFFVENPTQEESKTFTKTFNVTSISTVNSADLVVAADNSYTLSINGVNVGGDSGELNYFDENKDNYDVASYLQSGYNTITFVVKNWPVEGSIAELNPAGLLYKLTIKSNDPNCGESPTAPTVDLKANPDTINEGDESILSWDSANATSCSAPWTVSTSTSGTWTVSPATTTEYSISCTGAGGTATSSATVTVIPAESPVPSVTLNADPQTINEGGSSTLSWSSNNTSTCSAPWTTATSTSGSQVVSPGSSTDYSISCTGAYGNVYATTTVTVSTGGGGGGGGGSTGGGGGIGGHRRDISDLLSPQGEVLGATSCAYLRDYMRRDWNNDPIEVLKLQSFLNVFEGESLSYTTVFDEPTFQAVSRFQNKYFNDILEPWGHTAPTGFVYILTKKKVNEIYCNTIIQLTSTQQQEIGEFRAFITGIYGAEIADRMFVGASNNTLSPTNISSNTSTTSVPVVIDLGTIDKDGISKEGDSEDSSLADFIQNASIAAIAFPGKLSTNGRYLILVILFIALAFTMVKLFSSNGDDPSVIVMSDNGENNKGPLAVLPMAKEDKNKKEEVPEEEIVIEDFEDSTN